MRKYCGEHDVGRDDFEYLRKTNWQNPPEEIDQREVGLRGEQPL